MNIHEYQAKEILKSYDLPVGVGYIARSVEGAVKAYAQLKTKGCVVKAQIHAGGRGKAGGVILCNDEKDVEAAALKLLDKVLITHQTKENGQIVKTLYVEAKSSITHEFYLSLVLDRNKSVVTLIASREGGVNIEDVAASNPEAILKLPIQPSLGIMSYHARVIAKNFELNNKQLPQLFHILSKLYEFFMKKNAALIEINPLILTEDGDLKILDAKVSFDDNALFKHPDIENLRDIHEEDPLEISARHQGLSYIKLDGHIGCVVNGAGLAMATMDLVQLYGGSPANFLDVGGGANKEKVKAAFEIILSDQNVTGIFVNIFGGIMRCDIIAQGIVDAAKELTINIPVVVRLQGTNMKEGQDIITHSGLKIMLIDHLETAAKKIVALTHKDQ
jgi:succinyl-CoA synthetase beta subunit